MCKMRAKRTAIVAPVLALLGAVVVAVVLADESVWNIKILALLIAFAVLGDYLEVDAKSLTISGAFLAIGLAMVMLGPVPAVVVALIVTAFDTVRRRRPL